MHSRKAWYSFRFLAVFENKYIITFIPQGGGTVTFEDQQTEAEVKVTVLDDALPEAMEVT